MFLEYASDIFAFLWAVVTNWAGIATGGLIVALLWLWSTIKQQAVSRRLGVGLALLFLVMAMFNAWREQYQARKRLEAMSLVGQPVGLSIAPAEDRGQSAIVSAMGIISNPTGPPTVATQFGLSAIFENGETAQALAIAIGNRDIVLGGDGTPASVILKPSDFWPVAGLSSPIPTGGARRGWIIGLFKNTSKQKFIDRRAKVIVTFNDVQGKKYSMVESVNGAQTTFIDPLSLQPLNK